jgi:pimeloyl-ACP methyl ester carboxylesterase
MIEFPEFGHMAPVTHPEEVNEEIVKFLEEG